MSTSKAPPRTRVKPQCAESKLIAAIVSLMWGEDLTRQQRAWVRGIQDAAKKIGGLHVLLYACLHKGMDELHDTGGIALPYTRPMDPKLARRVAQVNEALNLGTATGFGDAIMGDALSELEEGDASMVYEGWDLTRLGTRKRAYIEMVQSWRKADGLAPLDDDIVKSILRQDWRGNPRKSSGRSAGALPTGRRAA